MKTKMILCPSCRLWMTKEGTICEGCEIDNENNN